MIVNLYLDSEYIVCCELVPDKLIVPIFLPLGFNNGVTKIAVLPSKLSLDCGNNFFSARINYFHNQNLVLKEVQQF